MNEVSSQDLHPSAGARFVFERAGATLTYDLQVYMPQGRTAKGSLRWTEGGLAQLVLVEQPSAADEWIIEGALKLARVLERDPKAKMSRWREA